MWNWQNQRAGESAFKPSLVGGPFKADFKGLTQNPLPCTEFNVRQHYQHLKENHPYYKELHQPHQKVVKASYLDITKSFLEER
jgi:hypothetical protein